MIRSGAGSGIGNLGLMVKLLDWASPLALLHTNGLNRVYLMDGG